MSTRDVAVAPRKQHAATPASKKRRPTPEEIAVRAYEIFLLRGAVHGRDTDDWLQAERELGETR